MERKYFSVVNQNGEEGSLAPIENMDLHKKELNLVLEHLEKKENLNEKEQKLKEELSKMTYKYYMVREIKE